MSSYKDREETKKTMNENDSDERHREAHALVEHPWHNKIKNADTRSGIDPNFFLIPLLLNNKSALH